MRSDPLCVDTVDGSIRPLFPGARAGQILLAAPSSGRVLLVLDPAEESLLVSAVFDHTTLTIEDPEVPLGLNSIEGSVRPLAFSTDGETLYLAVSRGVRSRLIQYQFGTDTWEEDDLPLGVVNGAGVCGREGLRFPMSTPTQPLIIVTVPCESVGSAYTVDTPFPHPHTPAEQIEIELLETANGPVEALVQGEPWRTADRVVIALHGGPAAHWRAERYPLLRQLAAAGVTVIAVNQRGSTGYGRNHELAIQGLWGGPDLADVHDVAAYLTARRPSTAPKLMIYGVSYGAYLALLAACTEPDRWSRCVAVGPFLSGEILYHEAVPSVRRMMDRLGGRTEIRDEIGPRNLLRLARNLRARTLIVHGEDDPVIPVSHSRRLYDQLGRSGRQDLVDYVEARGGHTPAYDSDGRSIDGRITEFLAAGGG